MVTQFSVLWMQTFRRRRRRLHLQQRARRKFDCTISYYFFLYLFETFLNDYFLILYNIFGACKVAVAEAESNAPKKSKKPSKASSSSCEEPPKKSKKALKPSKPSSSSCEEPPKLCSICQGVMYGKKNIIHCVDCTERFVTLSPSDQQKFLQSRLERIQKDARKHGAVLRDDATEDREKFKTTEAGRLQQEEELWMHSNIYLLFLHGTFFILFSI